MEIGNGNGNAPIAGARYCASARYYIGTVDSSCVGKVRNPGSVTEIS